MPRDATEFEVLRSRLDLDAIGTLTLNGQAMILLPRHFFRYILREVKIAAGPEAFRKIFHKAGHDGALTFCRRFREVHCCTPREAVEGYLKEMSLRGWGQFGLVRLDPEAGTMEVLLRHAAVAAEADLPSGNVIWEGAMLGAMTYLRESLGGQSVCEVNVRGEETQADCDGGPGFRIVVAPGSLEKTSR